jgi:glycosyltransferase involved in cell wall biosynthesis
VAKKIVTISEASKFDIVTIYKVPPEKVAVIHPGYNSELYQPRIPLNKFKQVKSKYGIKGKYFLFVGTLQPRKNIVRLIKAFAKLETKDSLVIVGKKGWLYDEILSLSQQLKIDDRVIFAGFAANEDLPALMKYSHAFVLPSLYEGFGIPVVEAQACGAIVVVSRVSSLPEVVGDSGIYIEKPDSVSSIRQALSTVLKLSKNQRLELKTKGKVNASRFSWIKAATDLVSILEKL